MFLRAIAALSFLLAASIWSSNSARANWEDAGNDQGGWLVEYLWQIHLANRANMLVPIYGVCKSACTLKLGARRACITRDADLEFHSGMVDLRGAKNPIGNAVFMSVYPPRIRKWVAKHHALDSVEKMTRMSGREAIALGIPECRTNPQSVFRR